MNNGFVVSRNRHDYIIWMRGVIGHSTGDHFVPSYEDVLRRVWPGRFLYVSYILQILFCSLHSMTQSGETRVVVHSCLHPFLSLYTASVCIQQTMSFADGQVFFFVYFAIFFVVFAVILVTFISRRISSCISRRI